MPSLRSQWSIFPQTNINDTNVTPMVTLPPVATIISTDMCAPQLEALQTNTSTAEDVHSLHTTCKTHTPRISCTGDDRNDTTFTLTHNGQPPHRVHNGLTSNPCQVHSAHSQLPQKSKSPGNRVATVTLPRTTARRKTPRHPHIHVCMDPS